MRRSVVLRFPVLSVLDMQKNCPKYPCAVRISAGYFAVFSIPSPIHLEHQLRLSSPVACHPFCDRRSSSSPNLHSSSCEMLPSSTCRLLGRSSASSLSSGTLRFALFLYTARVEGIRDRYQSSTLLVSQITSFFCP